MENLKFVLSIEAEAEVIPGPETQAKWAREYIQAKYSPEEIPE